MLLHRFAPLSAFATMLAIPLFARDAASAAGEVPALLETDFLGEKTLLVVDGDNKPNEIRLPLTTFTLQ